VGEVGDGDGSVGDEIEAAAAGAKRSVEVLEGLTCLGFEGRSRGLTGRGIDAGLPGDEEETAGSDGLGVGASGFEARDLDGLLVGHLWFLGFHGKRSPSAYRGGGEEGNSVVSSFGLHDGLRQSGRVFTARRKRHG
jgi:hypothetical protein